MIIVSTVSAYVAALGGELQFRAVLPNGEALHLDEMPVDDQMEADAEPFTYHEESGWLELEDTAR